ncbi:MAG: mechanosensitive ion channel family protein [Kiloniellales bacterium]
MNDMNQAMNNLLEQYGQLVVTYGLDLVGAILLLIGGWIVAAWAQRMTRRGLGKIRGFDVTVSAFLSNIARYLVLILVLIAVLAQFGVQTASILAVLGTAGLAVGLALQGTLSNIAAGLMLLVLRPFRSGDYIDAEGTAGTVQEIGLFNTELTTFDGVYLSVPNSQIWNRSILNYSRLPTRRLDVPVGISYGDDIDKAMAALMELMKGDDRVLGEPPPQVMVTKLADSSVNLNLRCWTQASNYWALLFDLNKRAKETVEAAGCTIPFPQREMRIVGGPVPQAAE